MSGKVRMGFSLSWFVHARVRLLGAANQDTRVVVKDFGETVPFNRAGIFCGWNEKDLAVVLGNVGKIRFQPFFLRVRSAMLTAPLGPGLNQSAIVLTKPRLLELQTSTLGW